MPGTAIVEISGNQWNVEVANTPTELTQGLSGRASLVAGTGMLFILPATQVVTVQTEEMLFLMDIIFISNNTVLSIARNISPGYLVEEATPCDMFLEVNALEAATVEVGDIVSVEITTPPQEPVTNDFSQITAFAIPLIILGFVFGMFGSNSSSNTKRLKSGNPSRQLGVPKTEAERIKTHYAEYGSSKLPERGKGGEKVITICPICLEEIVVPVGSTRSEALRKHIEEKHSVGHHSIGGEPRVRLVEKYGSWQVGRAEAVCPEEDVACVEREAKRLTETLASRYGTKAMTYVKITNVGKSVFQVNDTVSLVTFERENKRLRDIGEKEAVAEIAGV